MSVPGTCKDESMGAANARIEQIIESNKPLVRDALRPDFLTHHLYAHTIDTHETSSPLPYQ